MFSCFKKLIGLKYTIEIYYFYIDEFMFITWMISMMFWIRYAAMSNMLIGWLELLNQKILLITGSEFLKFDSSIELRFVCE